MIEGVIQPREIPVDGELSLVRYYPHYRRTLPWYQDARLCKQVDGIDFVYDLDRLKRMYGYLSKNGECYYIKHSERGRSRLIGDISLCRGELSIVVDPAWQNRHFGRRAVSAILDRAKRIGWESVEAEVYSFNEQSRRMLEAVGFRQIGPERFRFELKGEDEP